MKKPYSLDFSIYRDVDRLHAVNDILDTLKTNPSNTELEQMASYILYGKDENGLNAVQRHEMVDLNKRYNSFTRKSEKNQSLDAIIEDAIQDQTTLKQVGEEKNVYMHKKSQIKRPKYDKKTGALLDAGDSDIPGMTELWERIDYLDRVVAANEGRIPFTDDLTVLKDNYRLYKLRHQLIDMRRHQYYLKDAYKPTVHLLNVKPPQPQLYDWDSDSFYWISQEEWQKKVDASLLHTTSKHLEDYERREDGTIKWVIRHHTFDWEDPHHIHALLNHYSIIAMQVWDHVFSWGRTLIMDFDRYQDLCNFSPIRQYMITRRIDGVSNPQLAQEIWEKFGIKYTENHVSTILVKEIPNRIATVAKQRRLLFETPQEERKQCFHCKRWLPRDNVFFGVNNGRRDHLASNCKECEKQMRIEKGASKYDRRYKETNLLEVQATEND